MSDDLLTRHKRMKQDREREAEERQRREEEERKKEYQAILVPRNLFEDLKRHLEVQIPYNPHGIESTKRDEQDRLIKEHLHSPDLPYDRAHELWHRMDDLEKASAPVDLTPPKEDEPEGTIEPETAEQRALRLKEEAGKDESG